LEIEGGDLIVPRGPGLGVTVDESVIERYRGFRAVVVFSHRIAARNPRGHVGSQRPMGPGHGIVKYTR
jgi:hypothetical protein